MTDLEIIEAGVAALYSGDADRAGELFDIEDIPDDRMRQYAAYQAAIGGRLTLDGTAQETSGVFNCTTPYHNAMTDAIGYVDSPGDDGIVRVQDGVSRELTFPFDQFIMISLEEFSPPRVPVKMRVEMSVRFFVGRSGPKRPRTPSAS